MVESSSASMTAQSAPLPGRSAAATPAAMLAPARLQRTLLPERSMAFASTLLVVVLPFVPQTTMAPWESLGARCAMALGSSARVTRPGIWDALR